MTQRARTITNRIGISLSALAALFFLAMSTAKEIHWPAAGIVTAAPWLLARLILWITRPPTS